WRQGDSMPLAFSVLQTRIQRLKPSARIMEEAPVQVALYDLLELDGNDLRERPQFERRQLLEQLLNSSAADPKLQLPPLIQAESWDEAAKHRERARDRGVEGLMLKRRSAAYQAGRRRGDWWKWKIDPLTIDAVL